MRFLPSLRSIFPRRSGADLQICDKNWKIVAFAHIAGFEIFDHPITRSSDHPIFDDRITRFFVMRHWI